MPESGGYAGRCCVCPTWLVRRPSVTCEDSLGGGMYRVGDCMFDVSEAGGRTCWLWPVDSGGVAGTLGERIDVRPVLSATLVIAIESGFNPLARCAACRR